MQMVVFSTSLNVIHEQQLHFTLCVSPRSSNKSFTIDFLKAMQHVVLVPIQLENKILMVFNYSRLAGLTLVHFCRRNNFSFCSYRSRHWVTLKKAKHEYMRFEVSTWIFFFFGDQSSNMDLAW